MAQPSTNLYSTYDLGGTGGVGKINREDLLSMIYIIDPTETPFFSMVASKTKAKATKHEWNFESLSAAAGSSGAQIEADDTTAEAQTVPTRVANTTMILARLALVSGTQQAVTTVQGVGKEMARKMLNKGMELRRNIEAGLLENNAGVAGNDTTARELAGIEAWIKTNVSAGAGATQAAGTGTNARTAGTARAFTESLLKTVLSSAYSAGGKPKYILVRPFNKQALSAFAGNATRMIDAEEKKLVTSVDVYVSDFGDLRVVPSLFQNSTGSVDTALVLDPRYWATSELRPIFDKELAVSGDYEKRALYWEGTLEARNEAASGAVYDLTQS